MMKRSSNANDATPQYGRRDDAGSILILTMIFTIVLALIVIAMAAFATTGLKTSNVTTERTESNAATSSALVWVIDALAEKSVRPDLDCSELGPDIAAPVNLLAAASATVTCTTQPDIDFHPTVLLTASGTTADGTQRQIEVVVQVPRADYTVQVRSWTVD